ncbi:MAG: SRPBCC family protein [Gammaproteobacteria bacterium]|nr:SRPBCC family protein [Gammaproteobacteria bacterium]
MRKTIKIVLAVVAIFAVASIAIGLALPSDYHVQRSISVNAPPERIHALVGNLERWPEWTPWQAADPGIRVSYGAITSGVGARQSWVGESGSGELTFTESSPEKGVRYDLSFDDGAFRSQAAMLYTREADATRVTWTMSGDVGLSIVGRYFALMMDSTAGPMFEDGLARLKTKAEQGG